MERLTKSEKRPVREGSGDRRTGALATRMRVVQLVGSFFVTRPLALDNLVVEGHEPVRLLLLLHLVAEGHGGAEAGHRKDQSSIIV